jgi:hypothetical protein
MRYYWEDKSGQYRDPTADELMHAVNTNFRREQLQSQIKELSKQLAIYQADESKVFYDEAGFIYDIRHFIASGKQGLI